MQSDGCGGTVSCGSCGSGETCSGSGQCVVPGTNWWELVDEPDATNTGPNCSAPGRPSATLTDIGSCPRISSDGATLENFECDGTLVIDADNVRLYNFRIIANGKTNGIQIQEDQGISGGLFEYGEITSTDGSTDNCIRGRGFTGRYLHVHNCDDTQKVGGPGQGPLVIENSYYHDAPGGHGDTFQVYSESDSAVTIRNSSLECGGTSCLITTSTVGGVIRFEENWIYGKDTGDGTGYMFYCGWDFGDVGRPAIFLTRNLIDRNYRFGVAADGGEDCAWTDNLFMDTLTPLNPDTY